MKTLEIRMSATVVVEDLYADETDRSAAVAADSALRWKLIQAIHNSAMLVDKFELQVSE